MSWWDSAYRAGRVNWDPGEYDGHLPSILRQFQVEPCRVLDPGCGNGKSAVWLARRGFHVVGVDLSPAAIEQARSLADRRGVADRTSFHVGRFPDDLPSREGEDPLAPESFGLIMERAFLQHLGHGRSLERTVDILRSAIRADGILYSLMIASEGASGHWGIVRWSEREIRSALEPRFRILSMRRDGFTPGERGSVPAWITVARPLRSRDQSPGTP